MEKKDTARERKYKKIYSSLAEIFSEYEDCLLNASEKELILEVNLDSLHKLIEYVELIRSNVNREDFLIYRGVSNKDYQLIPSIMRKEIFSYNPQKVEVDYLEKRILTEFKKQARPYLKRLPRESKWEWEWLALSQHHYLPTRLLDWTERAGTALFFAVEKKEDVKKEKEDACVWAIIAPDQINDTRQTPDSLDGVRLYRPPHIVPRITMQQGCFTVHPGNYMSGVMSWIRGPKIKFIIKSRHKERIRQGLYAAGVNRAALFPDLDGLAKHLTETVENYKKQ